MIIKGFLALFAAISLSGCATTMIDSSVRKHSEIVNHIQLGDPVERVVSLLEPLQQQLPANARKAPERFIKDGVNVYIYFARSGRQPDGLTTDDEFTPYVFLDGKLFAIGWSILGGAKTHGQAVSDTYINVEQTVK